MFKINEKLVKLASTTISIIQKDYKKMYSKVGSSNAIYKGKQLPFLYFPSIYSREDVKKFEDISKNIFNIVNHSIDIYLTKPDVRHIWNFDARLEELILIPHRFKSNVPMGRFDFFYYPDGTYKFCELNTDGTSAMNEETPLSDILIDSFLMNEIQKKHNISRYELYQSWVEEVKSIYKEFVENGGSFSEKPLVAIMDYMSKGFPYEFEEFKKAFIKSGFNCQIVSPDELEEKDGNLFYNKEKIDIIYRRLVTRDMMEHYDELMPLIRGIKANKTCIIGSIKSQIVHTKKYFEALHHEEFRKYLSDDELAYIDKYIPYTSTLRIDENLESFVKNKEIYIIKPVDYYASKGVYAGKEFDTEEWRKLLIASAKEGYIIQEFCERSINKNLNFKEDGSFDIAEFYNITGIFVYNEKMKGIFTRAGFNAVISDLNDGYSLSSLVLDE
ncbi:hypothetical protein [Helicovermis profundi]|uniref:Glutathionylspermidine synthase pre-ATP-grasp-like domain-containing protein n=1 Tax=Helicovermis profundi TaxID=3065157 RepID=A0AAU9E6A6_9FIRM|nr:hypothetical protein HLPR_19710 [Clostridia bacterium S502]